MFTVIQIDRYSTNVGLSIHCIYPHILVSFQIEIICRGKQNIFSVFHSSGQTDYYGAQQTTAEGSGTDYYDYGSTSDYPSTDTTTEPPASTTEEPTEPPEPQPTAPPQQQGSDLSTVTHPRGQVYSLV